MSALRLSLLVVMLALAWVTPADAGRTSSDPTAVASSTVERASFLEAARQASAWPGLAGYEPQQAQTATQLIGAETWQAAGFSGFGVRVAILDSGFRGYQEALGRTLPAEVVTRSFRSDGDLLGGTEHGRRAAEIVHRVAPGARLYLVNFGTLAELSAAVDYLIEERVQVVSFSLGYIHNGPGDGTGPVNEIVTRGAQAGQVWTVASGNWAQQHWAGLAVDEDGDSILALAPGVKSTQRPFVAGDLITVSLRWDEPWGAACSDYDLEVFGPTGALVRASRSIQNCAHDPVEALQVLATQSGMYSVRIIEAHADLPRRLSLMVVGTPDRGEALSLSVPQGSLSEPADNPLVISVGALSALTDQREAAYSSRGPTADGRQKPDVLAPTGATAVTPAGAFGGTSAAAPHVAGATALLLEAFPASSTAQLRAMVRGRAVPMPAIANGSGAPRLDMGTLVGTGPLLPEGAQGARLVGDWAGLGLALVQYQGPNRYPLRFVHRLVPGREYELMAVYALDASTQRWRSYVVGAPAFVNRQFVELNNGQIVVLRMR